MFSFRCFCSCISHSLPLTMSALCLFAATTGCIQAQPVAAYPPPKNVGDPAQLGLSIQRTMALLTDSTPQHRNTVRILFYGQSITEQDWWRDVAADIKQRFPNADLHIENRALGGFSSQLLVKTAEADLYPFYPDLMIFHVYGAHNDYEDIIRRTRERTTSEVLIQTDHVTQDEDLNEETDPAKLRPDGKIWNSFMNYLHLPAVAKKYDCGLVDQRNLWKQYLRDYHVPAAQLLKDGVHQNAYGNYLMSELVKAYLVRRKDTPIDPMNCDTVHTFTVGKDVHWQNGKLILPFEGNRVDLIAGDVKDKNNRDKNIEKGNASSIEQHADALIRIDGKIPSAIPQLYQFTPALSTPGSKWPVILKLGWEKPLQLEEWIMEVTKDPTDPKLFTFALWGSKTGADGAGRSDQRFVSKSGRIVIDPKDWNVDYSLALRGIKPVPDKFVVHWKVVPCYQDTFSASGKNVDMADNKSGNNADNKTDKIIEMAVTVAQGLVNGQHTLEISGGPATPITAIRIYRPPVASTETPAKRK